MSSSQVLMEIDRLLHEPARLLALVQLVVVKRADFTWLLKETGMSRGNLSVQMNKLAEAGIVAVEKRFHNNRPQTLYQVTPAGKKALKNYKTQMQRILDALPD